MKEKTGMQSGSCLKTGNSRLFDQLELLEPFFQRLKQLKQLKLFFITY
jgi:hypothetical protein